MVKKEATETRSRRPPSRSNPNAGSATASSQKPYSRKNLSFRVLKQPPNLNVSSVKHTNHQPFKVSHQMALHEIAQESKFKMASFMHKLTAPRNNQKFQTNPHRATKIKLKRRPCCIQLKTGPHPF